MKNKITPNTVFINFSPKSLGFWKRILTAYRLLVGTPIVLIGEVNRPKVDDKKGKK